MNSPGDHLLWGLWGLSSYLILTRLPRPPRTAPSRGHHLVSGMSSIAVPVVAILLANILVWILFRRPSIPLEMWPLIMGTAIGIGILPTAFQTSPFTHAPALESISRFMVGLAWASCWSVSREALVQGNPLFLLLGAVGALLPDTLDQWVSRFVRRIDIHIVPDPLDPQPALVAPALARAITRCQDTRTTVRIDVYPGQDRSGQWQRYGIRLDNIGKRVIATYNGTSASASLPVSVTSDHPFTLRTGETPLSLELESLPDGRIQVHVMPWRRGWSHSLAFVASLTLITGLAFGVAGGLITGGAVALHLLMDQAGFTGIKAFFPFSHRRTTGLQLFRPFRKRGEEMDMPHQGITESFLRRGSSSA